MASKAKSKKQTNSNASKSKTKQKRNSARKKTPNKFSSWLKRVLLYGVVGFTFIFVSYLGYLDYTVRYQFEGKRWSIPAKVYANPVELYAGLPMSPGEFEALLRRMNYHPDARLATQGSYDKKGRNFTLNTRSFTFWDKHQESSRIQVEFSAHAVERIVDLDLSKEQAIVRLDPVQIGSFYPSRKEDRVLIKLEEAPDLLVQGLLATEDNDFYHHFGVSPRAIARAMWANIRAGGIVQGGSTITQQLVKNIFLTPERSLWRKANEALMAIIMDARFSKDEILEAYLNEVYLGQDGARSIHGFGLASEFYFGKKLDELEPYQIATLVALVKGPSWYDPRRSPERAVDRRNLVLSEMHEQGHITKRQLHDGQQKPVGVIPRHHYAVNRYPGFLDLVRRQLHQEYQDDDLTSEGLRIFTTLDTQVQEALESSIKNTLKALEKRPRADHLETAVVVTQKDSGDIVALAGGKNYRDAGFNRALDAERPIGSLIKPVVYLTALEYPEKYTMTSPVSDRKIRIKAAKGQYWTPSNYDHKEHGDVPLHTALTHSYNLATVRIGMDIGIARTAKTLRNMGVNRSVDLFPSLLLGASQLTPLEVTQMYQTLASDGFVTPLQAIRAVTSAEGEPLQRYPFVVRQALDPAATYITNTILQEVVRNGTGRSAYRQLDPSLNLAGKTGTTNELRDSWFAGFSGDYLAVVWIGRDDNKSSGLTGASGALQLWSSVMKKIAKQALLLTPPDNVQDVLIDPQTGLRANRWCSAAVSYPYIEGSAPTAMSACTERAAPATLGQAPNRPIRSWFEALFD